MTILFTKNILIPTFILSIILFSCNKKHEDQDTKTGVNLRLMAQVEKGTLDVQNSQIISMTLIGFKEGKIYTVGALSSGESYWQYKYTNWNEADSLIVFANMQPSDTIKIKNQMSVSEYHTITIGHKEKGISLKSPFLMKGLLTKEALTKITNGTISIIMQPMVVCLHFSSLSASPIENITIRNVASQLYTTSIPNVGTETIENSNIDKLAFQYYIYPSQNVELSITQNGKTLTKNIGELQANKLFEFKIEATQEPERKNYEFNIDNRIITVEENGTLLLPVYQGILYANLDEGFDLQLKTNETWLQIYSPTATKSVITMTKPNQKSRFVVSSTRGFIYRQRPSTQYIFDAYHVLEQDRATIFNVVEQSSNKVIGTVHALQKGDGNITIRPKNPTPEVGTVEHKTIRLSQLGGETQYIVTSSSANIEITVPYGFKSIKQESIKETPYVERVYHYFIEPSILTSESHKLLIVKDKTIDKADTIHIYQQPLVMSAERQLLMDIFKKLNGIEWTNNANENWNTGYPLSTWKGVTVNTKGEVTVLNLPSNSNIKGDFPIEITKLTKLESLILGENKITGSIPTDIKNLKNLKTFKTVGNQMSGDLPRELGALTKLSDLHISGQYHTGKIWKELQTLPAYNNQNSFIEKVCKQLVAGTETVAVLPFEDSVITESELRGVTLSKVAQTHIISMPGDVDATSFEYTSSPSGHSISLVYKTRDIMVDNKTMLEATLPANTTAAPITYNIKVTGRNRTTGFVKNYTCKIEQTTEVISRKDSDIRMFLDSKRDEDKSYGLVFMGDGFILEDLQPGGDYDKHADNVLSYIFSKEPFATYKDYFKVYIVYVESSKRGLGGKLRTWYNPATTYPEVDNAIAKSYAQKASIYTFARLIAMNIYDPGVPGGLMINDMNALFQVRSETIALHEYAHIFGLGDEYDYGGFPGVRPNINRIPNLDKTGDLSKVKWKHFIGRPGYESVGAYEGGAYIPTGVWRPEKESIMKNFHKDFNHFNAPSREEIVKKILYYSEEQYSFEEFLRLDKPTN